MRTKAEKAAYQKEWREKNKDYVKQWFADRYANNPKYYIKKALKNYYKRKQAP